VGTTSIDPDGWRGRRQLLLATLVLLGTMLLIAPAPVPAMCMPSVYEGCETVAGGDLRCCYTDSGTCTTTCRTYPSECGEWGWKCSPLIRF
jgi:hypothetical protein